MAKQAMIMSFRPKSPSFSAGHPRECSLAYALPLSSTICPQATAGTPTPLLSQLRIQTSHRPGAEARLRDARNWRRSAASGPERLLICLTRPVVLRSLHGLAPGRDRKIARSRRSQISGRIRPLRWNRRQILLQIPHAWRNLGRLIMQCLSMCLALIIVRILPR